MTEENNLGTDAVGTANTSPDTATDDEPCTSLSTKVQHDDDNLVVLTENYGSSSPLTSSNTPNSFDGFIDENLHGLSIHHHAAALASTAVDTDIHHHTTAPVDDRYHVNDSSCEESREAVYVAEVLATSEESAEAYVGLQSTPVTSQLNPTAEEFIPQSNIVADEDIWKLQTHQEPTTHAPSSCNLSENDNLFLSESRLAHSEPSGVSPARSTSTLTPAHQPHFHLLQKPVKATGCQFTDHEEDIEALVRQVKLKTSLLQTQVAEGPWELLPEAPVSKPEKIPDELSNEINMSTDSNNELNHENYNKDEERQVDPALIDAPGPCEPKDLMEGIIFTANYLGSTQLQSARNPGKQARMLQAQEAVTRIKSSDGEPQPMVEIDLFMSTDYVRILNAETQETMMEHTLRSISYIADIGELLVIMAKRKQQKDDAKVKSSKHRIVCHVFASENVHLMAQAIGQAFTVAYQQFLLANGIEQQSLTRDDYNRLLDMREMYHDDLAHYTQGESIKEVWVPKKKGEMLGVVVVESGWGSIVPTVILANLQHGGPAEKSGKLSIGDQVISINGTSLVGLPMSACQTIIKGLRSQTIACFKIVSCPPVVTVLIKRPDLQYQLGFSVQEGIICSLMRGGIAERGGVRVGHRIIEINGQSVVATAHEKIVRALVTSVGEIHMKTMPAAMFRLLTGQEQPVYI